MWIILQTPVTTALVTKYQQAYVIDSMIQRIIKNWLQTSITETAPSTRDKTQSNIFYKFYPSTSVFTS